MHSENIGGAKLVGRVWRPDLGGPSVVILRGGAVIDDMLSATSRWSV